MPREASLPNWNTIHFLLHLEGLASPVFSHLQFLAWERDPAECITSHYLLEWQLPPSKSPLLETVERLQDVVVLGDVAATVDVVDVVVAVGCSLLSLCLTYCHSYYERPFSSLKYVIAVWWILFRMYV